MVPLEFTQTSKVRLGFFVLGGKLPLEPTTKTIIAPSPVVLGCGFTLGGAIKLCVSF